MEKGGFLIRLVAYIIDAIILSVGNYILAAIFGVPMGMAMSAGQPTQIEFGTMMVVGYLIMMVWSIGYILFFWSTSGATPGKAILGLRIVKTDGSKIGLGTAILRYIGYFVSSIVFCLGYLWIIWDKDKQGWHDKIASTYVIKK